MDAIGRLAGGLAHNFGNLLTTIDIYTELALGNVDDEQSRGSLRNNLEEVRRASGRAADLVRRLLVFSRRQQLPPRVVDLKLVFDNLMGMLRPVIGEHITIATRFARDLGYVKANIGELEEVIVNLAANARDAMPDGGVLTFEAKNMVLHHTDALRLGVTAGSYSALSVSDTGEGIATDALDHIFEPFFTTKDIGRGTGLGLYMAHNVMRQNAGSIDVASSPGRGATFTILLPHVPEASEAEPAPAEPDQRGNGETILVVEDDEHLRISVERILIERGYRVLAAGSAEDGLALLEAREQPIDLLVSDLVLPGMSGFELAIPAQLQQPGLRTLFISGYPPQLTSRGRGPTAAAPIVQKPFTAATLARAVRDSLDARGLEEFRASP
jgi:CheY-like chemotaxis protein